MRNGCAHIQDSQMIFFKQQCNQKSDSIQKILDYSKKDLEKIDNENYVHSFFQVGFFRGGSNAVGGPLWCDK